MHQPRPGEQYAPLRDPHAVGNVRAEMERLRGITADPLRGRAGREQAARQLEQIETWQREQAAEQARAERAELERARREDDHARQVQASATARRSLVLDSWRNRAGQLVVMTPSGIRVER
jgi:hypothetical protein